MWSSLLGSGIIKSVENIATELIETDKDSAEAKEFLDSTDYKDLPNYEPNADEVLADVINARSVAREFIRKNKGN